MANPVATPISLQGGIYLQSREYTPSFHQDIQHIEQTKAMLGTYKPTHLGIIEPFVSSGYLDNMGGLYNFAGMRPEIIDVDGGIYTWDVPDASSNEFYIVEDLSCTNEPGKDDQTFKARFNSRKFGNGAILTNSQFSKFDLYVTEDEIVQDGRTWIYTLKLKGEGSRFAHYPKEFLRSGTHFTQKSSIQGDMSTVYNTGNLLGTTKTARFFNYVGQTNAHFMYTVGGGASGHTIAEEEVIALNDYRKVVEMYVFKPNSEAFASQLRGENPISKIYKGDQKAAMRDVAFSTWISAADLTARARIELDCQNEALWGTGGTVFIDGQVKYSPIGLYHQMNRGNQHYYSIETMTINKFNGILASFLSHRTQPYQNNVIDVTTGDGGFALMKGLLQHLSMDYGMIMNMEKFSDGPTNDMTFRTPSFTAYESPFGVVRFNVNKSLNPKLKGNGDTNNITNPMIGNYRLSSYMFIIMDPLNSLKGNNVKMLRNSQGWDTSWSYTNGKANYMGNQTGFHSSNHNVPWDFQVRFNKKHYSYWLSDPSASFIIKPYNPKTGKPFGEI